MMSPLVAALLQQQPQKKPQANGFFGKADEFLNRPSGNFLMNLLAQSGYSTMPSSPLGAIGRASIATQEQQRQSGMDDFQKRLIESQIMRNERDPLLNAPKPPASIQEYNLYSSQEKAAGRTPVSFEEYKTKFGGTQFITLPDGTTIGASRVNPSDTTSVVSPDEARDAATRAKQTEKLAALPTELAALDAVINKADETITKVGEILPLVVPENVGISQTVRGNMPGSLGGDVRKLKQSAKSLQANFGFDTLQQMRAASKSGGALGQVSERELDLLINSLRSIDLEGDADTLRDNLNAVVIHYENYKAEIKKMKSAMMQEAGVPEQDGLVLPDFSSMTDEQLRDLANGGQ